MKTIAMLATSSTQVNEWSKKLRLMTCMNTMTTSRQMETQLMSRSRNLMVLRSFFAKVYSFLSLGGRQALIFTY